MFQLESCNEATNSKMWTRIFMRTDLHVGVDTLDNGSKRVSVDGIEAFALLNMSQTSILGVKNH